MSPLKKYCFIVFGFILLPSNISAEIEMDYFFGENALRSTQTNVCKGDELKHECRMTCGSSNYGCIFNYCICLDKKEKKGKKKEGENLPPSKHEIEMLLKDFEDLIDVVRRNLDDEQQPEEVELTEHPALRHHIAHFCPNLSVARQCIRTCMKVGKPAFCGKDHHCYCGHRYNSHDEDKKVDVDDMYAQFRDLYTKYFGEEGGKSIYGK